jgi:hypothetical protein
MAVRGSTSDAATPLSSLPLLALVRDSPVGFSQSDMGQLAEQLALLIRDYYVNLPVKTSALAIDPVQELQVLADDVNYGLDARTYLERLMSTIKRLRDRHTSLRLPSPRDSMIAFLPFTVEACWESGRQILIVSKLLAELDAPDFLPGVEITHWNGVPIAAWIRALGERTDGANPWARIAVSLRSLTVRPLAYQLPPEEDWVALSYSGARGPQSIVLPWRVAFTAPRAESETQRTGQGALALAEGVDRATSAVNDAWRDFFAARQAPPLSIAAATSFVVPGLSEVTGRIVSFAGRSYGYLRIFSFAAPDPSGFLDSIAATLRQLPRHGLIIDVRANPGGSIPAAEGLLQLLTDRPIIPEPLEFRVTSALQRLVMASEYLVPWRRSMSLRYETGQLFTQGFSLLDPTLVANRLGTYTAPVVLIADAIAYSATDFFAAGWQDNGIGPIIGIDPVTGAGGANVWEYAQLRDLADPAAQIALQPLPSGAEMNLSLRRATRVLFNDGLPLEGLGVTCDLVYQMTRDDVLGSNEGLITYAASVLSRLR